MARIQEITITKVPVAKGGSQISWNFDLDGKPFGQVYTFKPAAGCVFPYTAKTLAGECEEFTTYKAAEAFMRGQM